MLGFSASATENEVKITSFNYTGSNTQVAEICGELQTVDNQIKIVEVTSDPNWKRPGFYSTIVSESGKFCLTIFTLTGNAEARLRGSNQLYKANVAALGVTIRN